MTLEQRKTSDRLASAAMLALDGASMADAATELGFPDRYALSSFLTAHRRPAIARRLWANGHPSRHKARGTHR